jgi:hypothetical protein
MKSETECYFEVYDLINCLNKLQLNGDPISNLIHTYEELVRRNLVPHDELSLLRDWAEDLNQF